MWPCSSSLLNVKQNNNLDDGKVMTVQMDYKLFVQEEQSRNEIVVFNLFLNLIKNLFIMYTYIYIILRWGFVISRISKVEADYTCRDLNYCRYHK